MVVRKLDVVRAVTGDEDNLLFQTYLTQAQCLAV
jgi:hypothetical protein